jgi:predicted kinase
MGALTPATWRPCTCWTRARRSDTVRRVSPRQGHPVAIILSGAPGSGKSTLARTLGDALRLPVVDKDRLREGCLPRTGTRDLDQAPLGPPLWYSLMEAHLQHGISVIGDMALFRGLSESDIAERLAPLADLFNIHCHAQRASQRVIERASLDPLHADRVPQLVRDLPSFERDTTHRLDLGCPSLTVDTTDGHSPSVETIVQRCEAFVAHRA